MIKKLPIIRHIRYYFWLYQVNKHYEVWEKMGSHDGNRQIDYEQLDKIWSGEI